MREQATPPSASSVGGTPPRPREEPETVLPFLISPLIFSTVLGLIS